MTADEAVEAARQIGLEVAVPMHYGAGVAGTVEEHAALRGCMPGSRRCAQQGMKPEKGHLTPVRLKLD